MHDEDGVLFRHGDSGERDGDLERRARVQRVALTNNADHTLALAPAQRACTQSSSAVLVSDLQEGRNLFSISMSLMPADSAN